MGVCRMVVDFKENTQPNLRYLVEGSRTGESAPTYHIPSLQYHNINMLTSILLCLVLVRWKVRTHNNISYCDVAK